MISSVCKNKILNNIVSPRYNIFQLLLISSAFVFLLGSCSPPAQGYKTNLIDSMNTMDTIDTPGKDSPIPQKQTPAPQDITNVEKIRVLLYQGKDYPQIKFLSPYLVYNRAEDLLFKGQGYIRYNQIHGIGFSQIFSKNGFIINKNHYQGRMFLIQKQNQWQVILELDLEEYVKGVIPYEMPSSWPLEALKAQAIAARSYAVFHISHNLSRSYHVDNSTRYQVFRGISGQKRKTNEAVNQTTGQILIHNNRPIPAYFHSSSGGITEKAGNVWGQNRSNFAFTQIKKDPYGRNAPVFQWDHQIDSLSFLEFLQKKYKLDQVHSFFVAKRTKSGRVQTIRLIGKDQGKKISQEIQGNAFRIAYGARKIRSLLFQIDKLTDTKGRLYIRFHGSGYGHGVGMSQWGAFDLAQQGKSASHILKYYYKNIELTTLPKTNINIAYHGK